MKRTAWAVWGAVIVAGAVWAPPARGEFGGLPGYVGSDRCRECHPKEYSQWRLTPHARMLVDAKRDPFTVLADNFDSTPFGRDEIIYSVGNHWLQKYLTRIDGILYQLPRYWNIPERRWEPYSIWNWMETPYNIHCDGCHTVGFDPSNLTFFEPGIGCESCHGPGQEHVKKGGRLSAIVNPRKLDPDRAQMICMACHTDGMDTATETFPFPVGFVPGEDLAKYYTEFFMPKPKSKAWYWGSMDLYERKRMFYFYQSKFYSTARACEVCGFDRGVSGGKKERFMTRSEYCGTCHKFRYENFLEHSGHRPEKVGCTDCHIPEMTKSGDRYSIHSHKFDFSRPPIPCTECHEPGTVQGTQCSFTPNDFNLKPVKYPREMTVEEACVWCHNTELKEKRSPAWGRETIPSLIDRFIVQ